MKIVLPEPRLLRREQAAHYLGISLARLDHLRVVGEISVVPMPSRLGGAIRVPLYDRLDLDRCVEKWKAGAA